MQYNTQLDQLIMPQYGRGVQEMVKIAIGIEDRQLRQSAAAAIVRAMAALSPSSVSKADNEQRLWNHLARIAHYKLDIDYPVEIIPEEDVQAHPAPLSYPMKRIRRRHYGNIVEQSLSYIQTLPEGKERDQLLGAVANQMKQNLFVWNRDAMDDELVLHDIDRYSDGALWLDLDRFSFAPVSESPYQTGETGKKKKKKR